MLPARRETRCVGPRGCSVEDPTGIDLVLVPRGRARVLSSNGHQALLASSEPFPPGATLTAEHDTTVFCLKVRGCRRVSEAREDLEYRVEGRWLNLSRPQRDWLLARLSSRSVSEI